MRVLMPTLVPHSERMRFLPLARFETGPGGNPHYHGCAAGAGNPRLLRVKADVGTVAEGDLARASDSEGGAAPLSGEASEEGSEAPSGGGEEPAASRPDGYGASAEDDVSAAYAVPEGEEVPEPVAQPLASGRRWFRDRALPRLPDNLTERNAGVQSQRDMEK